MPTITAVAFDSLLIGRQSMDTATRPGNHPSAARVEPHPRPRSVDGARAAPPSQSREEEKNGIGANRATTTTSSSRVRTPALYTTPKAFRVSADSTPSDSISPYVVDRKGRARGPSSLVFPAPAAAPVAENGTQGSIGEAKRGEAEAMIEKQGGEREEPPPPRETEPARLDENGGTLGTEDPAAAADADDDGGADDEFDDDFFDSRASLRSASFSDAESSGGAGVAGRRTSFRRRDLGNASFASTSEYYDAGSNFGPDSPAEGERSSLRLVEKESELRSMRLALFEQIEKRTKAEESLAKLRHQWNRMASGLSKAGLCSFPPIPTTNNNNQEDAAQSEQEEEDPVELVGREIVATRLVSEAIARGIGQAEAEESVRVAVEAKNREIARLRERLNYYQGVNHEMSQRNLEIAEQARRRRQRRKTIRQIMWGSVGFAVVAGASLLAYTYLPQSGNSSSPPSTDDTEASSSS